MKPFLICLLLVTGIVAHGQQKKGPSTRAKDAMRAARQATSDEARENAYRAIDDDSIQDEADVEAIYEELKSLPKGVKDVPQGKRRAKMARELASRLERCRSPKHHAVIKRLLNEEADNIPSNFMGRWGAKTEEDEARDSAVYDRLQALTVAAGEGKNESALPELRKMRRKGGEAGKAAEKAIGQIGKDEDFEEMVREVKTNPKSRVNLNVFGPRAMRRIVKEIKDPSVPKHEKASLLGAFPKHVPREDIPTLVELLGHEDRKVASAASEAISNSVTSEDEAVIRQMLGSPQRAVRNEALLSINRLWDRKYLPDVLGILKSDPDDWRRAYAVKILGDNKVGEARAALEETAAKDSALNVRESAQYALRKMK